MIRAFCPMNECRTFRYFEEYESGLYYCSSCGYWLITSMVNYIDLMMN